MRYKFRWEIFKHPVSALLTLPWMYQFLLIASLPTRQLEWSGWVNFGLSLIQVGFWMLRELSIKQSTENSKRNIKIRSKNLHSKPLFKEGSVAVRCIRILWTLTIEDRSNKQILLLKDDAEDDWDKSPNLANWSHSFVSKISRSIIVLFGKG